MTQAQIAAVIAEIYIGIAMAKSRGVVCGSPVNIRVVQERRP